MNVRLCPSPVELERGFFTTDAMIREHVDGCRTCSATWKEIDALRALAGSLAAPPAQQEALRARIIANAGAAPRETSWSRMRWAPVAIAIAASVAAAAFFVRDSSPIHRAQVHAIADAKYWRVSGQPDELVRLVRGSISVSVAELAQNERFRVVTGHGEVEVRGTSFDVVAKDDRLEAVQVYSGAVEVRTEHETRVLHAGDRWTPAKPVVVEPAVVEPVREAKPLKTPPVQKDKSSPATGATTAPVTAEVPPRDQSAYEAGWVSLRTGDHREAAAHFQTALEHTSDPSLEQDARYFLAVSLARAKDIDRAIETFEAFLARHASSPHFGEAAAVLGWLRYDRGEYVEAEAQFQRAIGSSATRARASGRDGLEALRRDRARTGGE